MPNNFSQVFLAFSVLLLSCGLTGCGTRHLESSLIESDAKIDSTEEREAILIVMEDYADALTALSLDRIRSLVSQDYYENNGTTHTTDDDYGYDGVLSLFETLSAHVADARVRLAIREINVRDDRADVLFDYEYTMLYRVGESERWSTERDVNRVELRNETGVWRIISGL